MRKELPSVSLLALVMAFRMLGLFMILPVFSVTATKLPGATPFLIGLALGIYGLTQAMLQMPFGALSDKLGRKPIIIGGLSLFVVGSIIAALSHSITGMIVGRALQGAGAVGSTILAMVADVTCDENRSKAMATLGLTIGLAFSVAMIIGPIINRWFELNGIFWLTGLLGVIGIVLVTLIPKPAKLVVHTNVESRSTYFRSIITNRNLLRLDFGIFALHATLTAMFIAIPIILTHELALTEFKQVIMYLVVLVVAFVAVVPLIIISEKKRILKPFFLGAIATLLLVQVIMLVFANYSIVVIAALFIFFAAFTLLEATLPSWISKVAPIRAKGTAMGIYSTSQFFGIFMGGLLGGTMMTHFHNEGIFVLCAILALIWLVIAYSMPQPPYLSTIIINLKNIAADPTSLAKFLQKQAGIAEVAVMEKEGLMYLKIDKRTISEEKVRKLSAN